MKQVQTEDIIGQLAKPVDEKALIASLKKAEIAATGEEESLEKSTTRKERKEILSDSLEKSERTLFLGNLPVACATDKTLIKSLKARFTVYGPVESVRFRSIPFAEPQARRVAFIKKNFRKDGTGGTCNGYVVMKTREMAVEALKENATIFSDRHLRVDLATDGDGSSKTNTKKSVFIGNLPMDLEEEPVWQLFGKCGGVTNVRLIRDKVTNMGKGIGYVTFSSKDSVNVALKLAGTMLGSRPVRVSPCSKLGMVEKKKTRATNLAEKRQKQAAALVKANPSAPVPLGAAKAAPTPSPREAEEAAIAAAKKVSKKEAKLQAELKTKFGQLFHKKFPFAQAISEVDTTKDSKDSKDAKGSKKSDKSSKKDSKEKSKVVDAKVSKPKSTERSTEKFIKRSTDSKPAVTKSSDAKFEYKPSKYQKTDSKPARPFKPSARASTSKPAGARASTSIPDGARASTSKPDGKPFKPTKIAVPTSRNPRK